MAENRKPGTDPLVDDNRMVESLNEKRNLVHPTRMDSFNKAVNRYDGQIKAAEKAQLMINL